MPHTRTHTHRTLTKIKIKSNQILHCKTCHKTQSKCQLQHSRSSCSGSSTPGLHWREAANNLCDVSKSNQIMRQKCRKSVKCFANGCQRLLCCLLTRLRMNSRTNAPACALVWERTHTTLHPYTPLHIYIGLGGALHLAAKIASKSRFFWKMLCKMCAKVFGKYVSSSARTVSQMYLVSLCSYSPLPSPIPLSSILKRFSALRGSRVGCARVYCG